MLFRSFDERDRKIDWRRFHRWFTELHAARRPDLTPHEGWCALRSMILGDTLERDEPRFERSPIEFDNYILDWFIRLKPERQQGLAVWHMEQALRMHRYYREWKTEEGLWDESDLLSAACSGLAESSSGADLLVVDEAQDLTPDILRFVVRSSAANRFRLDLQFEEGGSTVSLPILLAADDLQTINPSGFTWRLARTLFHSETAHILNSNVGVVVEPSGLETNFRMRELVNDVASALRTWVRPEVGQTAHRSVRRSGYSGPCMTDDETSVRKMLHSVSRIVIPREIEMYGADSSLVAFLARHQIDPGQVLHVTATKGDEFSTVALVGFAEYTRDRKSTRLNSSHVSESRMPSSA